MEKIFNQWALEGSKVTRNWEKMKISAHSCAQTLSQGKKFFSCTVSLNPNLEYTSYLRSVSHQLKGVRDGLKSSNFENSEIVKFHQNQKSSKYFESV